MCGTSQVNSSLPVYQLTCSVCKGQFSGRNTWLKHLTEDNHQKLARLECLETWDSELRKCCLLLFTSTKFTVETAEEIVKYFSNQFNNKASLVTDFVWWADRPQLGILQFESRGKVKDVLKKLSSNGSSDILLGSGQSVQVRAGSKLMKLEWDAILPPRKNKTSQEEDPKAIQNTCSSEPIMEPEGEEEDYMPPSKRIKLDELFDNSVFRKKAVPIGFLFSDQPLPPSMTSTSHPLQFEYWTIRKAILIPDNQYNQAIDAASLMKRVLAKLYPKAKVHLFRNWYLKLKFPGTQPELLLFVNTPRDTSDLSVKFSKFWGSLTSLRNSFELIENPKETDGILEMKYLPANLKLSLVTSKKPGSLMEFQVCRMLEYLCQFDPRCHALITLTCYWVTINSINLTGRTSQPENPLELPPHYTIQWLVIFFMIQAKITTGINIGFSMNPNYVQILRKQKERLQAKNCRRDYSVSIEENSEEFLLSLLQLFHEFLHFCQATLGNQTNWILNTADGLLIHMEYLNHAGTGGGKQGKRVSKWKKIVKGKDVVKLRDEVKTEISVKGKCEMYMTHPFLASQKISLSDDIKDKLRGLSVGVGKMDAFLKHVKDFGVPDALTKWGTLKDVLTN